MFYIASLLYLLYFKVKFLQGTLPLITRSIFLVNVEELYKTFAVSNLSELYIIIFVDWILIILQTETRVPSYENQNQSANAWGSRCEFPLSLDTMGVLSRTVNTVLPLICNCSLKGYCLKHPLLEIEMRITHRKEERNPDMDYIISN